MKNESKKNKKLCRFCFEDENDDSKIISPCMCKGSMKYVHHTCLIKWIQSSSKYFCPVCKYNYEYTEKSKNIKIGLLYKYADFISIILLVFLILSLIIIPNIILFSLKLLNKNEIWRINLKVIMRTLKLFTYITFIIITYLGKYNTNLLAKIYNSIHINNYDSTDIFSLCYFTTYHIFISIIKHYFPLDRELKIFNKENI